MIESIPNNKRQSVLQLGDGSSGYYDHITKCASEKIDDFISNDNAVNAAHIITQLFQSATKSIDIYSGCLAQYCNIEPNIGSPVYSFLDLRINLLKFLEGVDQVDDRRVLHIVLDADIDVDGDESIEDHPVVKMIEEIKNSNHRQSKIEVVIKKLSSAPPHGGDGHMVLVDGIAFRYESDHIKHAAVANFGNVKLGEKLQSIFDHLFLASDSEIIYEYKD